jgi:hypothetical protein
MSKVFPKQMMLTSINYSNSLKSKIFFSFEIFLIKSIDRFGSIESVQMKKQFKSKDFNGAAFVVFPTEEKAREFVAKSKETPMKYEDGSLLECSLQDDHYKKRALESATSGKSSDDDGKQKRTNDKQTRKDQRKDEIEKKTNEHLEKLNTENLAGALIHLAGMKNHSFLLFL